MLLVGCPDYTLKGTVDLTPEGSDSADTNTADTSVPEDSEDPLEDTGDTQIEETEDEEICDGVDNDGDGEIDEGFEDSDGDGIVDCLEITYTIDIAISVDDIWEGWSDGIPFASERAGWNVLDEYGLILDSGPHVIAIHGWDTGRAISGHLSTVSID